MLGSIATRGVRYGACVGPEHAAATTLTLTVLQVHHPHPTLNPIPTLSFNPTLTLTLTLTLAPTLTRTPTLTPAVLQGEQQEHRNMPLDDAMAFVSRSVSAEQLQEKPVLASKPAGSPSQLPEDIRTILGFLAAERPLSVMELDKMLRHLAGARAALLRAEYGAHVPAALAAPPLLEPAARARQEELQARVAAILARGARARAAAPAITPALQAAIDSLVKTGPNLLSSLTAAHLPSPHPSTSSLTSPLLPASPLKAPTDAGSLMFSAAFDGYSSREQGARGTPGGQEPGVTARGTPGGQGPGVPARGTPGVQGEGAQARGTPGGQGAGAQARAGSQGPGVPARGTPSKRKHEEVEVMEVAKEGGDMQEKRFNQGKEGFNQDKEGFSQAKERYSQGKEGFSQGKEGYIQGFNQGRERLGLGREGFQQGNEDYMQGNGGFTQGREGSGQGREGFPQGREGFSQGREGLGQGGQERGWGGHQASSHSTYGSQGGW